MAVAMKNCRILGCGAARLLLKPTFRRNASPSSSVQKESALVTANVVPSSLMFLPGRWRRYVPFQQDPHGATSQETAFFLGQDLAIKFHVSKFQKRALP
jgi:hypothetical protein